VGFDEVTVGNWVGKYGSVGYHLFSFDGAGKDVANISVRKMGRLAVG
jgi:hypothetical protein